MKKLWGLEPVFALWSLGSIIGLPALLFSLGYLVNKGHNSLLNVPTVLLPSSAENLVFLGGQWIILTLQEAVWNKFTLVIFIAVVCVMWLVRRFKVTTKLWFMSRINLQTSTILSLFLTLTAILVVIEINIISYTSEILTTMTETKSNAVLMYYFEAKEAASTREWIYYFLTLAGILIGTGLFRILNKNLPGDRKNNSNRSKTFSTVINILQFFSVVLGLLALLNLPMCYGRLIMPYTRPVIQFEMKDKDKETPIVLTGLVLNPTGDKWLIVAKKRQNNIDFYEFSNIEMKDVMRFRINTQTDLFEYFKDTRNVQGN